MNQQSQIGFGTDATVLAGYAQATGDRLGAFDLIFENTGANDAVITLKEYTGTLAAASPSGYANIGGQVGFTIKAGGGTATRSIRSLNKRMGFFGSGNTLVNITTVIRNKADLRGAQIDIISTGRRGWGYDPAFDSKSTRANWGVQPDDGSRAPGEVG